MRSNCFCLLSSNVKEYKELSTLKKKFKRGWIVWQVEANQSEK